MTLKVGKRSFGENADSSFLEAKWERVEIPPCAHCPAGRTKVGGWDSLEAVERGRKLRTWSRIREEKMEAVTSLPLLFPPLLMI